MTFAWPSTTRVSTVAPAQMVINSLSQPGAVAVDSACGCYGMCARARDPSTAWSLTYGGAGWGGADLCPPSHIAKTGLCTHLRRAVAADGLASYLGLVGSERTGVRACGRALGADVRGRRRHGRRDGGTVWSLAVVAQPSSPSTGLRHHVLHLRPFYDTLVCVARPCAALLCLSANVLFTAAPRTLYVGTCNQLHVARLGERPIGTQWATIADNPAAPHGLCVLFRRGTCKFAAAAAAARPRPPCLPTETSSSDVRDLATSEKLLSYDDDTRCGTFRVPRGHSANFHF